MKTESYTLKTKFVWVLITDGTARLAFDSEEKGLEYLRKDAWRECGTTLQKVYAGVEQVPTGELERNV